MIFFKLQYWKKYPWLEFVNWHFGGGVRRNWAEIIVAQNGRKGRERDSKVTEDKLPTLEIPP